MTALETPPIDPREGACAPTAIEVEALHLCITQRWTSGATNNLHLMENGDLGVILSKARRDFRGNVPAAGETGTVVVSLGVDDEHDEIQYSHAGGIDAEEALGQAIEQLVAARYALRKIRQEVSDA